MLGAAEVLADIGHPRAEGLMREAADYRECIRVAVKRAVARADKITLPNGETIPFVTENLLSLRPAPMDPTGPKDDWGPWMEFADNGPLWMVFGKVFDANEDEMTWLLRFLKEYPVRLMFQGMPERGTLIVHGVTFLGLPGAWPERDAYFWRDEIDNYVEWFYSTLAGGLSWKTYNGRDHRAPYGSWYGPIADSHTSSGLRQMLVQEAGKDILLAWAIPRAWLEDAKRIRVRDAATHFGPMSYEIRSKVADGVIEATIEPPARNPPAGMKIKLRFRHPDKLPIKDVTVDGEPWQDFREDTITIPTGDKKQIEVMARF